MIGSRAVTISAVTSDTPGVSFDRFSGAVANSTVEVGITGPFSADVEQFAATAAGTGNYTLYAKAGTTVAYLVIRNNGNADRLVAAHTSAGGRVTFRQAHGPGAALLSTIGSVRIPGHGTLAMRPNGVQMLITGAGPMRGGKDITLTLDFAHAGPVSVVAQVTNPQSGGSSYFLN